MQLSEKLSLAVELLLRGLCNKQIAQEMGIEECTLDTYFARIGARTGAYGRTAIFRHVLKVSHDIRDRAQLSK